MYIQNISINNYKNLVDVNTSFSPRLNCIIGNNGSGKTNLMDAIYYLSFCKSFINATDQMNIKHDENFFIINGIYNRLNSTENISCGLQSGQKKAFKRNSRLYKKLSNHIGLLPLVIISPSDSTLIQGGSDERRKFMDGVISQYNHQYLDDLLKYNRALLQRNNLLKQFTAGQSFDQELLSVWDSRLIEFGQKIHLEREKFVQKLVPVFQKYYSFIAKDKELVGLEHQSELYQNNLSTLLDKSLPKDRLAQYTTSGIHKDELLFKLDDYQIKKIGSQGQNKTYLIALKLAQYEFINEISGMKPILLLDDIFDKLDRLRVEQIVKVVAGEAFGQIFITDTNREHLDDIIKKMNTEYRIFQVSMGVVKPMN